MKSKVVAAMILMIININNDFVHRQTVPLYHLSSDLIKVMCSVKVTTLKITVETSYSTKTIIMEYYTALWGEIKGKVF